jgi:Fe-S-cluster containining protein
MIETKQEPSVACLECGALCCNSLLIQTAGMSAEDIQYWSTIGHSVGQGVCVNMQCKQLVDNKCSIYDARPTKCRTFAVGGTACQMLRHAHGVK